MNASRAVNVSALPEVRFGPHEPFWWGNALLLTIETVTMAMLVASYFYVRKNFDHWPPPRVDRMPALFEPVPDLGIATLNLFLLVGLCIPMAWADRAARRQDRKAVTIGLAAVAAVAIAASVLRFFEFPGLHFLWNDNAYASIVWSILGMHLIYLVLGVGELIMVLVWTLVRGLDEKHALDVTLTAGYWYWLVGTWIPLYLAVYWAPRIL